MFKRNYTNHIIQSIVICIVIPAVILFVIMQMDHNAFTRYHFSQVATAQLEDKIEIVHLWLKDKEDSIDEFGFATEAYMQSYGFDDNIPVLLTEMAESSNEITHLYVTTEVGANYVSKNVIPQVDGRSRSWYKGASQQGLYISAPYEDVITGELVLTFSKAIRDSKGRLEGVIGMDILLEDLVAKIEQDYDQSIFHVLLKTDDGSVPYRSSVLTQDMMNEVFESEDTFIELDYLNTTLTGLSFDLSELHSRVYIFLDMNTYNEERKEINRAYLLNLSMIIMGLFVLIKWGSRYLYRPLAQLNATSEDILAQTNVVRKDIALPGDLQAILEKLIALDKASKDRQLEVVQMNMHVHERNDELHSMNVELVSSFEELQLLNQALELQEKSYHDLVSNIPDVIWITEPNGRLIYGNEQFEELIGAKVDSNGHSNIAEYIEGLSRNSRRTQLFHERDFGYIEINLNCSGGTPKSMSGSISRIFEEDRMIAIQGVFRDMSDMRTMYYDYYSRNRELTLVNDITKSLISKDDLNVILKGIVNKVGHIMNVSLCTIRLILDDDCFHLRAYSGSNEQMIYDDPPRLEKSHMGLAFKKNKCIIIHGEEEMLMEDPDLSESFTVLKSVIYIPMATNDNVYGIMTIGTDFKMEEDKIKILESLADQAAIAVERMRIFKKLRNNYFKTIEALVAANDAKVSNMEGHTKRVSDIAVEVGRRMYLRKQDIDEIYIAGLLHDIGKMRIRDTLLSMENERTREEQALVDLHPMFAKSILEPIGMSKSIVEGIYYHHKKFDLSGEPKNESISTLPLIARIIGAVDGLDALLIGKNTKTPNTLTEAISVLSIGKGTDYCPEVIKILEEIANTNPELIVGQYIQTDYDGEAVQ